MTEFLTRSFFEEELPGLQEAYARDMGAEKVSIELMLRNGVTLKVEGRPTCSDSFIAADFKSGTQNRRVVFPYGSVMAVGFTTESGDKKVGFHR
jgi:hypothetical protein